MNDDIENLDRLADELEGLRVDTPAPGLSRLEPWLRMVADRDASDLSARRRRAADASRQRPDRRAPIARRLDGVDIEEMVLPELPPHAQRVYRDARHRRRRRAACPGVGRFRINLHRERGRAAAAIRMLPAQVPLAREPRSAVRHGDARAASARSRHRRRRHRLRQDDDAGGARRRHQPARRRSTSSRSRIRSNTSTSTRRASSSRSRSASTRRIFRRRCDRRSARHPTSSSSARCATRRRCASRSRRGRPATSC